MEPWHLAYQKLAALIDYYFNTYKDDAGNKIYQVCVEHPSFQENRWFSRMFNSNIPSLDPIQIFSTINESRISQGERLKRLNAWFSVLGSDVSYNEVDFTGCPAPFSLKILVSRKEKVQNEIWQVFHEIIWNHHKALNNKVFLSIKKWYGIDIPAFTIFLFWIDSSYFLPLDSNTVNLLRQGSIIDARPNTYQDYIVLLKAEDTDFYRKLAEVAFYTKDITDLKQEFVSRFRRFFSTRANFKSSVNFKIIAIKPLPEINKRFLKVLKINRLYSFYESFDFTDETNIKYIHHKDFPLFNTTGERANENGKTINISAIAGKNGNGKSSITELLYAAINNLSLDTFKKTKLIPNDDLHVRLYFHTDTLYRIDVRGRNIKVLKFGTKDNLFVNPKQVQIDLDFFQQFFYTIAINYSHHSLNSVEIGDWIVPLFHKNDGYQAPLVINPKRNKGNIDINQENDFVKTRLLANILEPDPELRKITENGRSITHLRISIDKEKSTIKKGGLIKKDAVYQRRILKEVFYAFGVQYTNENDITKAAKNYIYKKLVKICLSYPEYKRFFNRTTLEFHPELFVRFLYQVEIDKSHVTFKLKQAINYLRFSHLRHHLIDKDVDVAILSKNIQNTISENFSIKPRKIIELIPPAFFKIEMILSDESNFDHLSSGEKQRIHTVSSLVYHLLNLDSIESSPTTAKYECVNILFDEVELYFHPEMQRTFINYTIDYLSRVSLPYIGGLNFCFVTHSPFILSDIPDSCVMFLKLDEDNKAMQVRKDERTFGANIHELLHDGFFLDNGSMGEFAKHAIQSAALHLEKLLEPTKREAQEPKFLYPWNEETLRSFIDLIGEPLIRNSLRELFLEAYFKKDGNAAIDREIQRLESKKVHSDKII